MLRPLDGVRVLVTRPSQPGEPLREGLRQLGAEVLDVPTIEIRPLPFSPKVESALAKLPRTQVVVFTSANSVRFFFSMLSQSGRDVEWLASAMVCAVGPSTADSLRDQGVAPSLVAESYTADHLGAALLNLRLAGMRILIPRVRIARDALPALLTSHGASVEVLPLYETICPPGTGERLREIFEAGGVDLVTFASSSSVTNFVRELTVSVPLEIFKQQHPKIACLGPVTAATARRYGMDVDIIPQEYTTAGLIEAIVREYFQFHL